MSARRKARKRALDILFAADVREDGLEVSLMAEATRAASEPDREASWLYAREIVDGIIDNAEIIDETIETHARGWKIARMPAVDRAILRLGTWELLFNPEVPSTVAVSEAVELATQLSTDDSPTFINGVLGAIAATPR
ncbi:MAG: transcription antitermination factor NusB [Actinobacteria bacterium]|nr:transcription antitermination factor NusB [Actinomycetota bacterium]